MATIVQLQDQIDKLNIQIDGLKKQAQGFDTQIAAKHKQLDNAQEAQRPAIQQQIQALQKQKAAITGKLTEDELQEDGEVAAGGPISTASVSTASYMDGVYQPPVFGYTKKKKPKVLRRYDVNTVNSYIEGK